MTPKSFNGPSSMTYPTTHAIAAPDGERLFRCRPCKLRTVAVKRGIMSAYIICKGEPCIFLVPSSFKMSLTLRRRSISRIIFVFVTVLVVRFFFFSGSTPSSSFRPSSNPHEIQEHNVLERVTRGDKTLNVQRHKFLQARVGRDERDDLFGDVIRNGVNDFWDRFQKP
jgi:hypothetical protein